MCVVIGWYGNNPPSSKEVAGSKDIFDTAFDCASKVVETAKPFVKEVVMAAAADVVVEIGKRAIEDATGIDLGSSRRKS